jgi:hypothetical protein
LTKAFSCTGEKNDHLSAEGREMNRLLKKSSGDASLTRSELKPSSTRVAHGPNFSTKKIEEKRERVKRQQQEPGTIIMIITSLCVFWG